MAKIEHITARQILDSRGNPTLEADVYLEEGSFGRAAVPSGVSTGSREAVEVRDGGTAYGGRAVTHAVLSVKEEIAQAVVGMDAGLQGAVDERLITLDGTENKSRLGANALLAVSLAVAKAHAAAQGQIFFERVQELAQEPREPILPLPMCNLINGGKHAAHSTDIQEFMVIPIGAESFSIALRMVSEVFYALRTILEKEGYATTVGDEGGFAPTVRKGNKEALELLARAVEQAGYVLGKDAVFAIDAAASEFYDGNAYTLTSEQAVLTTAELIDYYVELQNAFPLVSIEDGIREDDWDGWNALYMRLGGETQIVGDDLLVTNPILLNEAIQRKAANAILIKPNQIGTLTETIAAVDIAHRAGWKTIVSHRSGETEDTTIAHLAVGLGAGQIKVGSVSRGERTAKYNELLRIEELF